MGRGYAGDVTERIQHNQYEILEFEHADEYAQSATFGLLKIIRKFRSFLPAAYPRLTLD